MKKAHVFSYSQVIKTVQKNAIDSFADKTTLPPQDIVRISKDADSPGGIIYNYKIGNVNTIEFRAGLNQNLAGNGGLTLSDEVFDSCWNSMCIVEHQPIVKLYDLQAKNDFHIHVIGRTNELQHNFIQDEIKKCHSIPEVTYTCSFEKSTLDIDELQKLAADSLAVNYYQPEWHYSNPESAVNILAEIYHAD